MIAYKKSFVFEDAQDEEVKEEDSDNQPSGPFVHLNTLEELKNKIIELSESKIEMMKIKRQGFLDFLEVVLEESKIKKWARISVGEFLKFVYQNQNEFFNRKQKEKLDELMQIFHEQKNSYQMLQKKREALDHGILQTPLNSKNDVVDNRDWGASENGLDKWSYNQLGL